MRERLIDSWVSSLIGFGLILLALGFTRVGDKVSAGVCFALGIGLISHKETSGKPQ